MLSDSSKPPLPRSRRSDPSLPHPLASLGHNDLDIITEFVLLDGSITDLARRFRVSYPTMRSTFDGTIGRLKEAVRGRQTGPLASLLAALVERGEVAPTAARQILAAARQQQGEST